MTEYRASFDATIRFSNGGDLTAHGFRVDVPSPDMDEDGIAALFVASLGLLMTDSVTLANVEIFAEPHKGTRAGPSDHSRGRPPAGGRLVELNHVIRAGMVTYPGLPGPEITPYLTREASREHYAPGTEFAIDRLTTDGVASRSFRRLRRMSRLTCTAGGFMTVRAASASERGIDDGM